MHFRKVLDDELYKMYAKRYKPRFTDPKNEGLEFPSIDFDMKEARLQLREMRAKVSAKCVSKLVNKFSKAIRTVLRGLHVDERSFKRVKQLLTSDKRVVLMPLFGSLFDILIHTFISHYYQLDVPFVLGCQEAMPASNRLIQQCGLMNSRRTWAQSL
jgi:hypothetical protein